MLKIYTPVNKIGGFQKARKIAARFRQVVQKPGTNQPIAADCAGPCGLLTGEQGPLPSLFRADLNQFPWLCRGQRKCRKKDYSQP